MQTGFVLCSISNPVPMVSTFECQLVILELLEHNPIFTVGYRSVGSSWCEVHSHMVNKVVQCMHVVVILELLEHKRIFTVGYCGNFTAGFWCELVPTRTSQCGKFMGACCARV